MTIMSKITKVTPLVTQETLFNCFTRNYKLTAVNVTVTE